MKMQELQLTNQMEIIGGGVGTLYVLLWEQPFIKCYILLVVVFQFQDLFLLNGDNK